ncbi:MAG: hypothetical protein FWD25_04270 [Clostridia bacterium]|nr:hypothetical protein [Clostridia bacterium]
MMSFAWATLALTGVAFAMAGGLGGEVPGTMLRAAMDAVSLAIRLAGGFAFWSGLMAIVEDSGLARSLARLLAKPLSRLFPGVPMAGEAGQAITMNLTANILGLGNAATPMGLKAMRLLGGEARDAVATDAMCLFLVLNASSVQLLPTSVIALRAASGSAEPASILLPTLIATTISTVVGVAACILLTRRGRHA